MKLKELLQNQEFHKIDELITSNPEVLDEKDENGTAGIVLLAYYGLEDIFKRALTLKKEFTFHEAIICGLGDVVMKNLEENPELINKYSEDGFVPISLAAYFNRNDLVKMLLEKGADPNLQATNGSKVNALHSAVARENTEVCKMLIDQGIDVNAVQAQNVTALHSAAHRGSLHLVKMLVEAGADPGIKMESGQTAADLAAKEGFVAVKDYLDNHNLA